MESLHQILDAVDASHTHDLSTSQLRALVARELDAWADASLAAIGTFSQRHLRTPQTVSLERARRVVMSIFPRLPLPGYLAPPPPRPGRNLHGQLTSTVRTWKRHVATSVWMSDDDLVLYDLYLTLRATPLEQLQCELLRRLEVAWQVNGTVDCRSFAVDAWTLPPIANQRPGPLRPAS